MIRRLLASSLVLISFMLVVLGVPFWRTIITSERQDLQTDLERDAVVLAGLVEDSLSEVNDTGIARVRADAMKVADRYSRRSGARVVIVDAKGVALADNEASGEARSFASRPEIVAALTGRVGVDQRYSQTLGRSALFVAVPVSSGGVIRGAVRLSFTTAELDRRIRSIAWRLVLVGSVALVAATGLAVIMARSLQRPIVALRQTAQAFGQGHLRTRAPTSSGAQEVRALGVDFNTMASRIEELITAQDAFVADASHQLRSPLTAARLGVEALAYASPDHLGEEVDSAVDELSRLSRIIDGLLELARPDRPESAAGLVDLQVTIADRVEAWSALADEREICLVCETHAPLLADVKADRLSQILDNLFANALDASPPGSSIRVSTGTVGGEHNICVDDEGRGMTDDQRRHAFDRLWRADSRRTELSGSGLGLPIARKLARADRGDLALAALASGGTRAVVSYPARTRGARPAKRVGDCVGDTI